MRQLPVILLVSLIAFSCVKQNTKNPKPVIEFIDFANAGKSKFSNGDTAVMVIGYQDGDGDLFVNSNDDDINIVFTPYAPNNDGKFTAIFNPAINDTFRITNKIKQPDNGYYKGKSIKGQIYMPLKEYRTADKKILKFVGFMIDMKKNKSNVVTSPTYTLNF
jgi:hypothetical protein